MRLPKPTAFLVLLAVLLGASPTQAVAAPAPAVAPTPGSPTASAKSAPPRPSVGERRKGSRAHAPQPVAGQYIVTFAKNVKPGAVAAKVVGTGGRLKRRMPYALNGAVISASAAEAAALARRDGVLRVEQDARVSIDAAQTDPPSWGLDRIDQRPAALDQSYGYTNTGSGVTVYVIDTGIRADHQEFGGRVQPGADYVEDGRLTNDCEGHGTHVAGTIGGATYGVAKGVTLVSIRTLDCAGNGYQSDTAAALDWITYHHPAGAPAVVNLSLGGPASATVNAAVQNAVNDGVTVVVSAGNDSADACGYSPASAPNALTVAATQEGDDEAWYSNYGTCVDLYAPGTAIVSAGIASRTAADTLSGTSMASPHVAGAAALVLNNHPAWSPAQVMTEVKRAATADAVGNPSVGTPNLLLHTDPHTPGMYVPVSPARVLDTRSSGAVGAHETVELGVAGSAGVPGHGVTAVVLNVTVTAPMSPGNVTVYPWDAAMPSASNLNFSAGTTRANLVVVRVDSDGWIKLTNNSAGTVQLIADVAGYYRDGVATAAGAFRPLNPARILDTRSGSGAGGPVAPHGTITLQVVGRGGVPGSGAGTVALNVTETQPTRAGNVTVYPSGTAMPTASNLNYVAGLTAPNLVVVKVGADGKVKLTNNSAGTVHLIADVSGYFVAGSPGLPGTLTSLNPARTLDTRSNLGGAGPVAPGGTVRLRVWGSAGVPAGASAVTLNVTVTQPGGAGNVTVYPSGTSMPTASNINFVADQTVPNLVKAKVGSDGCVNLRNNSSTTIQLIADVQGYYR